MKLIYGKRGKNKWKYAKVEFANDGIAQNNIIVLSSEINRMTHNFGFGYFMNVPRDYMLGFKDDKLFEKRCRELSDYSGIVFHGVDNIDEKILKLAENRINVIRSSMMFSIVVLQQSNANDEFDIKIKSR